MSSKVGSRRARRGNVLSDYCCTFCTSVSKRIAVFELVNYRRAIALRWRISVESMKLNAHAAAGGLISSDPSGAGPPGGLTTRTGHFP